MISITIALGLFIAVAQCVPSLNGNPHFSLVGDLPSELYPQIARHMDKDAYSNFLRVDKTVANALRDDDETSEAVLKNSFRRAPYEPVMEAAIRGFYKHDYLRALAPTGMTKVERNMTFSVVHKALRSNFEHFLERDMPALADIDITAIVDPAKRTPEIQSAITDAYEAAPMAVKKKYDAYLESIAWADSKRDQRLRSDTDELVKAVEHKDLIFLEKFVKIRGMSFDETDADGWTPLTYAASEGRLGAVRTLVEAGAKIDHGNDRSDDPGDDEATMNPLCYATMNNRTEVVRYLVERGAELDCNPGFDAYFSPAISYAIERNFLDIIRVLLEHGTELSPYQSTDVIMPMFEDEPELIRLAMEIKGADYVLLVDTLEEAIEDQNVGGVKRILDFGVPVNAYSFKGDTPLMTAIEAYCKSANAGAGSQDEAYEVFVAVLARDPDINGRHNRTGATVLMKAAQHCSWNFFNAIREIGGDIGLVDSFGQNVLLYAIKGSNWNLVRHLIDAGMPLTQPLIYSRNENIHRNEPTDFLDIFSTTAALALSDDLALLEFGLRQFNGDVVSRQGHSAFTVAQARNNRPMMAFLQQHGIEVWSQPIGKYTADSPSYSLQCPTGMFVTQLIPGFNSDVLSDIEVKCSNGMVLTRGPLQAKKYYKLSEALSGIKRLVVGTNYGEKLSLISYGGAAVAGMAINNNAVKTIQYPPNDKMTVESFSQGSYQIGMRNLLMLVESPFDSNCALTGLRFWHKSPMGPHQAQTSRVQFRFAC